MLPLLDSCGWLAHFLGEAIASKYAHLIHDPEVSLSVVSLHEVYRRLLQVQSQDEALSIIGVFQDRLVLDLSPQIAIHAAELSRTYPLHATDSLIYATALSNGFVLWTHASHFRGLPQVHFVE